MAYGNWRGRNEQPISKTGPNPSFGVPQKPPEQPIGAQVGTNPELLQLLLAQMQMKQDPANQNAFWPADGSPMSSSDSAAKQMALAQILGAGK